MSERKGPYTVRKVDANQPEIVEALRAAGASVQILSGVGHGCPDVIVGLKGRNYLFEIKARGGAMTRDEIIWQHGWNGQYTIVRTVDQALECLINLSMDDE